MKKSFFCVLVSLLAASCTVSDYTVVISNNSSKDVTFDYNGENGKKLVKGQQPETYSVQAYTPAPQNILVSGAQSVKMIRTDDGFDFTDKEALKLEVENKLSRDITITATGNLLEDVSAMKTELTVEAGKTISDAKIYTRTPHFEIVGNTGSQPVIEWDIDETTKTMSVTVK